MSGRRAAAPKTARAADTRARILDAARRVLAEEGLDRFTTRRVAAVAGVSHGMCHYHFRDKRDLTLALIESARQDWVEPLERIVGGTSPAEDRARAMVAWMAEPATIDVMRVHSALFWFALGDETIRARLAAEYARWRLPFVTLFRELAGERGITSFDARDVGESFAAAADGLVQQQALDPQLPTAEILTGLLERILGDGGTPSRRADQRSRKRR
jgi:AcrR family transcriptional regulator